MNTEWDNDSFRSRPRLNRAAVWTGSGRPQRPAGATSFILLNEILWRMMVHEQSVINVAFMPTVIDRPYKLKFISCYSPGLRIWHTKRRIWSNTNSLIQASPRFGAVHCMIWNHVRQTIPLMSYSTDNDTFTSARGNWISKRFFGCVNVIQTCMINCG